jgi:hypothetical protein
MYYATFCHSTIISAFGSWGQGVRISYQSFLKRLNRSVSPEKSYLLIRRCGFLSFTSLITFKIQPVNLSWILQEYKPDKKMLSVKCSTTLFNGKILFIYKNQCSGSMTFWYGSGCGSGSSDPYLRPTDLDADPDEDSDAEIFFIF